MGFLVFSLVAIKLGVKVCCYPFYIVDKAMSDYHERQMAKMELELLKAKEKQDK